MQFRAYFMWLRSLWLINGFRPLSYTRIFSLMLMSESELQCYQLLTVRSVLFLLFFCRLYRLPRPPNFHFYLNDQNYSLCLRSQFFNILIQFIVFYLNCNFWGAFAESRNCSAGAITEMLSPVSVSSPLYSDLSISILSPSQLSLFPLLVFKIL